MNKLIPFTVFCSLLMIAFAGKQPEVVGVMDPVATYSGMTTLCEAGSGGAKVAFRTENYVVYAIPFPRPPGYAGLGANYVTFGSGFDQTQADVLIPRQQIDDAGIQNSTEHYVSANITGCEAWVSLVPREDIGVPFQGSSLTGENIDSGGNFEVDLALAIHVDDPADESDYFDRDELGEESKILVFGENDFLFDTEDLREIRYFMNITKIATESDMYERVARIGLYSDLRPAPLNCDMLLIMIPNGKEDGIKVFDGSGKLLDYNGNPRDDCVQVLWGVAVYYDVAVPFTGRGSARAEDESPVSVRTIISELTMT